MAPPALSQGSQESNPFFGIQYQPPVGDRDHDGGITMFKQGGSEALYGIKDPIPVLTKDSPIVLYLLSLHARGNPHMERLMEEPKLPGPTN